MSLGCPKNLIDSETMLGDLAVEGFALTSDYNDADVVVINTCGFLDASRRESLDHIKQMLDLKEQGRVKRVVVAGCMVGNYREILEAETPNTDALVSVNDRSRLTEVLRDLTQSGEMTRAIAITDPDEKGTVYDDRARLRMTPRHYSYLRISEGCDHKCAFCVIPSIRGRFRSKPREQILEEAQELAADGCKELVIVAQDSTYYGLDTVKKKIVHEVLADLAGVDGIEWVRLMYAYPTQVTDDLIDLLANEPKLNAYIDMPLQHMSSNVLRRMKRGGNRDTQKRLVDKMRERIPNLTLRSTFIVGFPGETDEDFEELMGFIEDGFVDRAGAFPFSDEEQAESFAHEDKVPEPVIQERHARFMEASRDALFRANEAMVGHEVKVLIDGPSQDPKYPWVGRTPKDAPEIDCNALVSGAHKPGDLVTARVAKSLGYDLLCTPMSR